MSVDKSHCVQITAQKLQVPQVEKPTEYPRYWLTIKIGSRDVKGLLDTGAARTVLGGNYREFAKTTCVKIMKSKFLFAQMANGQVESIEGEYRLPVEVAGIRKNMQVLVVPNLPIDLILGLDFMRYFKLDILASRDKYTLAGLAKGEEFSFDLWAMEPCTGKVDISSCGLVTTSDAQRSEIEKILDEELPRENESKVLRATDLVEHEIELLESARPVKQRYFPVSEKLENIMHEQIRELEEKDIVERSHSEWNNPVVMVRKPNGEYRMCIDFRIVNKLSKKDSFPLPYMDVVLNKLKKARYISTIDLSSAYHQVRLKENSREITAFTIPGRGLWHYKRLPMGLSGAGACFQRLIEKVIGDLEPHAYSYLDDIVLVSETFEEHKSLLRQLLRKIKEAGLTINRDKSKFCQNEVKYLGFLVNEHGMMIDPEKTQCMRDYPRPRTLRQIRRFVGLASWYRKFIKDFAKIANPITKLIRKDFKYEWGEEQESAFNKLKELLAEAPLLHRPDPNAEFVIHCDACDTGLGACITQEINGVERVISYASRALRPNEVHFSTTEKECLAVKWAIEKFRMYVEGATFTVITDHSALQWLLDKKNPVGRLGRWVDELMSYSFRVKHRPGSSNIVPDALSRLYEDEMIDVSSSSVIRSTDDSWYNNRASQIQSRPKKYRDWKISNGLIYKYRPNAELNEIMPDLDAWKLVVPKEDREKILRENHDEPTAGHLGIEKTYKRIGQTYYWPGIYDDVTSYVNGCVKCQMYKVEQKAQVGFMKTRIVNIPWEIVAADLMEFPRSKNGFEYLLIFEDLFTRYIICVPIRRKTAPAIIKAIENVLCANHGVPGKFVSDNGKEFDNGKVKQYLRESNIKFERTPIHTAQSNPVERVNRDVKTMIAIFVEENHKEWDRFIPQFTCAHNTSVHSTTGKTPAFLIHARELKPPKSWRANLEGIYEKYFESEGITGEVLEDSVSDRANTDNDDDKCNEDAQSPGYENRMNESNKVVECMNDASMIENIHKMSSSENEKENECKNERHREESITRASAEIGADEDAVEPGETVDANNKGVSGDEKPDAESTGKLCSEKQLTAGDWAERIEALNKVYDKVREKIAKEKAKQAKYYNQHKREFDFPIGSKVMRRNFVLSSKDKNFNAKLAPKFIGPFIVAEKLSTNVYMLEKDGKKLENSCHSKDLKIFRESEWHDYTTANREKPIKKTRAAAQPEDCVSKKKRGRPPKTARTAAKTAVDDVATAPAAPPPVKIRTSKQKTQAKDDEVRQARTSAAVVAGPTHTYFTRARKKQSAIGKQ